MKAALYLTPGDHGRPLTLEEFESAGGQGGFRYELIRGRLDVSPWPDLPHEALRKWLERLLDRYAEEHPETINKVYAPARVFVPGEPEATAPEPDIAAYADYPRDRPFTALRWQDVSPVLVVEIISPDTADKDTERNVDLYLAVPSIREYWILDPRQDGARPSMQVYRRRGRRWQRPLEVEAGGTYEPRLLPGFTLTLQCPE